MTRDHAAVLERLVERAMAVPGIVAIAAYGSTASGAWNAHSDIDLIFIMAGEAPVNSLHFFVDGIPVDLNLKPREAWEQGDYGWLPPAPITRLWDPDNLFVDVEPPTASSSDAEQDRYAHRHRLFKLTKWIGRDDKIADLMAAGATHWIAVSWFHARNLRFPGIDLAVAHWREAEPEMIEKPGEIHMTSWHGPPGAEEAARARALLAPLLDVGTT
jgi:predicted nucleotidyltransferase